jgi:Uma2 family endonuclease
MEDESDDVVVQPDLMVVCDKDKLKDGKSCKGAPDFIIEVLSETTKSHDLETKCKLYCKAGVKEYWVVGSDAVKVYKFVSGAVEAETIANYGASHEVSSITMPGLVIKI